MCIHGPWKWSTLKRSMLSTIRNVELMTSVLWDWGSYHLTNYVTFILYRYVLLLSYLDCLGVICKCKQTHTYKRAHTYICASTFNYTPPPSSHLHARALKHKLRPRFWLQCRYCFWWYCWKLSGVFVCVFSWCVYVLCLCVCISECIFTHV